MIVPVKSDKYDILFAQATKDLRDKRVLTAEQSIDNINEYYAHMKHLYSLGEDYRHYILMPLDGDGETPYIINLNTRAITVPSTAVKLGAVQADQMAELIIFEADRFFDYMDLAETSIYVQWQLPDADKTKGATMVTIKDLESKSKEGKIRFAWPLNNAITSQSGVVKFSVRFFLFDKDGKLAYALNTDTADLVVKSALDPSANPSRVEHVGGLFENAILNSRYGHKGVVPPVDPRFGAPGTEMTIVDSSDYVRNLSGTDEVKTTQVAKLGDDKKLILKVQAIAGDAGNITYQWKFTPDTNTENWVDATKGVMSEGFEEAVLPVDAKGNRYLSYADKYYTDTNDNSRYLSNEVPNFPLYEKYCYYTIQGNDGDDVVGTYAAVATNTATSDIKNEDGEVTGSKTLKSNGIWSARCYLPGPKDIVFDSKSTYTLSVDKDTKVRTVVANLESDINQPELTYNWYRNEASAQGAIDAAKNKTASAKFTPPAEGFTPGWYAVRVDSKLNLKTKSEPATVAQKVCAIPAIKRVNPADNAQISFPVAAGGEAELVIAPIVERPSSLGESADKTLYRNLSYRWFYKAPNTSTWKLIEDSMISESDTSKLIKKIESTNEQSVLTVRNIDDGNPYQYRCEVTNTLLGFDPVVSLQDDNKVFLVY